MDRDHQVRVNPNYEPTDRDYYQMMEIVRRDSVNRDLEEARKRNARAARKKRAIKTYRIQGAILAAFLMTTSYFTIPKVVDAFTNYSNDSYHAGYWIVSEETHRTQDNQGFWFDYTDKTYAFKEGMDFDSFCFWCI